MLFFLNVSEKIMTNEELFRIWDRFENSKATELTYEADGQKLTLKKEVEVRIQPQVISAPAPMTVPAAVPSAFPVAAEPAATVAAAPAVLDGTPVKAPLVGTFYRASAPGETPFVKLGQEVKKGDTIGIIEAMKFMNEIKAPCDGTVAEILAEDESLVEYDQVLMLIKES